MIYPSLDGYDTGRTGSIYLTVYHADGVGVILNRTLTGISEIGTTGTYLYAAGIDTTGGYTVWDDNGTTVGAGWVSAATSSSGGSFPDGYTPVVIAGPEGSPNGVLAAVPQTVVLAADGSVFVKSLGNDAEGWIQTVIG